MKNVTISLPDDLEQRARIEAVRKGKSLSQFIADFLDNELMGKSRRTDAPQNGDTPQRKSKSKEGVAEKLMGMARRWAAEPELDPRHPDDILYDEFGLPK